MPVRRSTTATDIAVRKYQRCPAKTYTRPDGAVVCGRTVIEHCQIVGEVARALIARYPTRLGDALFPEGSPLAAASHDTGKVSPTFFNKLMKACQLPQVPGFPPEIERQWGGHAGVSQVALEAIGTPRWLPEIAGQHHGFSPPVAGRRADAEQFGGSIWQAQRAGLVDELKARLAMDWPQPASVAQARLIAGLTSVADWVGSGRHFENPETPWQPNIARALDEAGLVPPTYRSGLSFEEIFGFLARPAQRQLIEAAKKPGVYVLEAPMGLGKTEAALYVAYRLLEQEQACGVYFALPTQLTSNKIHERFNQFLDQVLDPNCPQRALLLHANAWLVDTEMGEEGRPGGAWFNHAKRGLLAPFAVGTIDQALMAAMHVKHGFVRAFGLAGKVVILDEVHTYDAYTGTLLDALVKLLRELHCTVIILSATLNHQRRSQLLDAPLTGDAYPLITALPSGHAVRELPVATHASVQVAIHLERDEARTVHEALERASAGQQVLWVENSVKDAQQRYLDVASRASALGIEHGLLHSRYTMADRARIEDRWVNLFGKPGRGRRAERGRILVGTQVLEQSLDIDADFLVSRFAPTDMLLQRMGRLWRHADTPRPTGARCEVWLLAPELDAAIESPQAAFGASAYVYAPYVLCRSLAVWHSLMTVCLPQDIRGLIEATYAEQSEDGAMARWLHELDNGTPRRKGRNALAQLARLGLAVDGKTLPESKAQTRYSETDSLDLLLLRDMRQDTGRHVARLVLLDGSVVELPTRKALPHSQRAALKPITAQLMRQIVPVRPGESPAAIVRDTLEKYGLQHCFYLGNTDWAEDESLLRVALVDESGTLRGLHGQSVHDKHTLEYRDDLGYRVIRADKENPWTSVST
ncbi:CRISPR-associated protein Cas3 [Rhodanobacter sp. Root561]|uniref:CRISPR-associated helicase Cas3' n=1 Tax=Rhodanobacter sp. Root561 TaxID=1736560 RepID=UPI000700E5F4|nr:CRISPR-associated helicase Cas3' [Rhodanobacter sp. Root561]KQZ79504.1 CRISPR-associated protein Cas3 [Rhodanobacter sp. Root561]